MQEAGDYVHSNYVTPLLKLILISSIHEQGNICEIAGVASRLQACLCVVLLLLELTLEIWVYY